LDLPQLIEVFFSMKNKNPLGRLVKFAFPWTLNRGYKKCHLVLQFDGDGFFWRFLVSIRFIQPIQFESRVHCRR
jgi:hypothetical protein